MEETIECRVKPEVVWSAWERTHSLDGETGIEEGKEGKAKFKYRIVAVKKGESFSILWKTLFVRLIFTQTVVPLFQGSQIGYRIEIKGLFAAPLRFLLGNRLRQNIQLILKQMVRQLESS